MRRNGQVSSNLPMKKQMISHEQSQKKEKIAYVVCLIFFLGGGGAWTMQFRHYFNLLFLNSEIFYLKGGRGSAMGKFSF